MTEEQSLFSPGHLISMSFHASFEIHYLDVQAPQSLEILEPWQIILISAVNWHKVIVVYVVVGCLYTLFIGEKTGPSPPVPTQRNATLWEAGSPHMFIEVKSQRRLHPQVVRAGKPSLTGVLWEAEAESVGYTKYTAVVGSDTGCLQTMFTVGAINSLRAVTMCLKMCWVKKNQEAKSRGEIKQKTNKPDETQTHLQLESINNGEISSGNNKIKSIDDVGNVWSR